MTVLDMIGKAKVIENFNEAINTIESSGISINYKKILNPLEELKAGEHILENNLTLIRIGKKNFHIIKWEKAE